ncbi:MAG TPA: cation:proton antiporter [Gemmatimonadaceae bacterium]|nr:cation:proton antiporter [Gemmatimonadaceae bacterium]
MHEIPVLRDLVILVAIAIPVVIIAQRLRVPTVVGFLLTGIAIGPNALGLVAQPDSVASLAEVGVVLLLFAIGLELSLSRIVRMRQWVLRGGGLQVTATIAAVAGAALALGAPVRLAIFFGALFALSSTAIILKVYTDRSELDTPHGRIVVAILLFQDLCVVPLMLMTPLLAGTSPGAGSAGRSIIISAVVVATLILGGRLAVPRALRRIAELRNREIFTLSVVFIGLGAAYVTSAFGMSLALGAFIAGLIISESDYGLQALSDVLPFRDTFSGIFFIAVGMLLDVRYVAVHATSVVGVAVGVMLLKTLIVIGVVRVLKRSVKVGVQSGLSLAQVGEFSFVLAGTGVTYGLLAPDQYQLFLGASVLSMLATPFVVGIADRVAEWTMRFTKRPALMIPTMEMPAVRALRDHVIIVGYGLNGNNLARALEAAQIPYVVLEQNGQLVRRARLERTPIFFGDGTRAEVLEKVGIEHARVLVYAIAAPAEERRGVAVARHASSHVRIVVRTRYVSEIDELRRLGADEVVPEELETSIEIFARVLRRYGVEVNRIRRLVDDVRSDHYGMFLTRERSVTSRIGDALAPLGERVRLQTMVVDEGAKAAQASPASLGLRKSTGATVIAFVRKGAVTYSPDPATVFEVGDEVLLVGDANALEKARAMFGK